MEDSRHKGVSACVVGVDVHQKQSIWGYHADQLQPFMKVQVAMPQMVATARRLLERGITVGHRGNKQFSTYESNLPFVLRFMVDKDICGGAWLEVPPGSYRVRGELEQSSHAQLELDVHVRACLAVPCCPMLGNDRTHDRSYTVFLCVHALGRSGPRCSLTHRRASGARWRRSECSALISSVPAGPITFRKRKSIQSSRSPTCWRYMGLHLTRILCGAVLTPFVTM